MARYDFGGTLSDFTFSVASVSGTSNLLRLQGATLTFWSAQTGGTQYTSLRLAGADVSTITVDSNGQIPAFQGPDGVKTMWASGGGGRQRIVTWTNAGATVEPFKTYATQTEAQAGLLANEFADGAIIVIGP